MINDIDKFLYTQQNHEGELRYVLRFAITCYNEMLNSGDTIINHEEKITAHLVEDYLKNVSVRRRNNFEGYTFERESSAGIDKNYADVGYIDIKVIMKHTFEDPKKVFIIECKRLDGNKHLNREYIEEGILRFITKKYPTTLGANSMLGFCVKKFDSNKNVEKLNSLIVDEFPSINSPKNISFHSISNTFSSTYSSEHHFSEGGTEKFKLYHVMLDYSSLIRAT